MANFKTCGNCAMADFQRNQCRLLGHSIGREDFCSKFTTSILTCDNCGRPMPTNVSILCETSTPGEYKNLCLNCYNLLNTCHTCENNRSCAFQEDNSGIPKVIQQQVRQGPMTVINQVMNPDLVNITCRNGCACFNEETGCCRGNSYCDKYSEFNP